MPRTHVYRHFDGKPALDLAVSTARSRCQIGSGCAQALAAARRPREIIAGAIDEHLRWVETHPNLYRFLAQHAYACGSRHARTATTRRRSSPPSSPS